MRLSVPRILRRSDLILKLESFTSWFHQRVTFLPFFATPSRFFPHTRVADEATTTGATPSDFSLDLVIFRLI